MKVHCRVRLKNNENEKGKNEDLEVLFNKPNIKLFLKTKRLEWVVHIWRAYESLIRNVKSKTYQKVTKRKTSLEMVRQGEVRRIF